MLRIYFQEENNSRTEITWDDAHNGQIEDIVRIARETLGDHSMKRIAHNGWAPLEKVEL
jgi:hypothetical protein